MVRSPKIKPRRVALTTAVLSGGVALFIFDEILFGAPVLALTKFIGAWPTLFILTPLYFAFDYTIGTLALNAVKKWKKTGRANQRSRKFSEVLNSNTGKFSRWLLVSGGAAGFVVSSYLGTAFLTMPLVYLLGRRRHLRQLTIISAAIYALTFVGQYTGIGAFLFN